jgi:hypothetical protein
MKLFQNDQYDKLVYAVIGKNDREGTAPRYIAIQSDNQESAEMAIEKMGLKSCYPYPMGRYDQVGRYETYKPAVDGVGPGRYVLHPLAQEEYLRDRPF